jgi:flagellar biosynthesis protein FlhG
MIKTLSETVETFLKCRLHILGGVKKEELPDDHFDTVLLHQENNSLHKNFVNIVNRFTEEIEGETRVQDMQYSSHFEQVAILTV